MTGVNGAKWYHDSFGVWDSKKNAPDPKIAEQVKRSGVGLVRYPGGTSSNLFNWKAAVGPQSNRSQQLEGKRGAPVDSRYGPDEYMRFVRKIGATPEIMAPFANSTPQEIADWVAYMNAPQGTQWGDLRAQNGHPEPYGVRCWEIGNELFGKHQRYWLSADDDAAMRQYAFGGTQRQTGQRVGTPTDHRPSASISSGEPLQSFTVWYPPVVPKSQTVKVNGVPWREVDDLSSAGADDRAYTFEPDTGTIRFGDGRNGKIPPKQGRITADYGSGPHAGFVDYYAAMKAVDPTIEVLSCWALIGSGKLAPGKGFPELMAEHGHAEHYDGVAIHPYTNFSRDLGITRFPDKRAGHDYQMLGEAAAVGMVTDLMTQVRKHGKRDAYVAVSECGALFFGGGPNAADAYPEYSYAMSHALYMASQWSRFSNIGVPWTASNDLVSESGGQRTLLGGDPKSVRPAEAVVREQLRDVFHGGGHVVESTVRGNTDVTTRKSERGASYPALVTTSTVDREGSLNLVVVNRSPDHDIKAKVAPEGTKHSGTVHISVVAGKSYHDFNSEQHPDNVKIETTRAEAHSGSFDWTFQAHSVTRLRFPAQ
ncbi:alpha-L-arabinofuranosidase C-terminal domain-containing protein [Streptomyces sp. NPDC050523]|uniref:alpha-L-arabinofuranosidase C-terminal domain-containing protein n=1 Tax=Streptomyces sp. NPDC050523 TaxID=3365622 RepID=UPI00379CF2B4